MRERGGEERKGPWWQLGQKPESRILTLEIHHRCGHCPSFRVPAIAAHAGRERQGLAGKQRGVSQWTPVPCLPVALAATGWAGDDKKVFGIFGCRVTWLKMKVWQHTAHAPILASRVSSTTTLSVQVDHNKQKGPGTEK